MILFSSISLQRETVKNLTSSFSTCSAARKTESKKLKKKRRGEMNLEEKLELDTSHLI